MFARPVKRDGVASEPCGAAPAEVGPSRADSEADSDRKEAIWRHWGSSQQWRY